MSAAYSVVFPNSVQMLADGACYTRDGRVTDFVDKFKVSPHVPLAVTGRGQMAAWEMISAVLIGYSSIGSVDRTMDLAERMLTGDGAERMAGLKFEILIAGWSETEGPFHRLVVSHSAFETLPPFTWGHMPDEIALGPILTPLEQVAAGIPTSKLQREPEATMLRRYGADIMEAMRRKPGSDFTDPESPSQFGIGGHCDLVVVTENGVERERLRTWPDVIGEFIDPFAHDVEQIAA